jgi:hypothetical protein
MGVWRKVIFAVKYILQKSPSELAEIGDVYAGFSPVREDGRRWFVQQLVAARTANDYMLCFDSWRTHFLIRHNSLFAVCCFFF